jgi:hypothetical protein
MSCMYGYLLRWCWAHVQTLCCIQLEAFSCVALSPLLCCPQVSEYDISPGSIQLAAGHSTAQHSVAADHTVNQSCYYHSVSVQAPAAAALRKGVV